MSQPSLAPPMADELEPARGVTHDFIKMGRAIPEAPAAQRGAADALKRALFA